MPDLSRRFSIQRPYHTVPEPPENYRLEHCGRRKLEKQLESDRGRIINSAAVRRLQQKTQVFPLEHNAAVRSRLTHSLEVQQTGRFIVRTIFERLGNQAELFGLAGLERACETLVEMACLMHDIGNPPFGHFGEAAISRWFEQQLPQLAPFSRDDLIEADSRVCRALLRELSSFEGNAQAIRLISQLQKLNLTYSQAACIFKYTRCATEAKPEKSAPLAYLKKKPGYYYSEREFVAQMQAALAMAPGHRFPLAYLMEAADDIAYCLADLEDGVDKGILDVHQLTQLLKSEFNALRAGAGDSEQKHFRNRSFAEIVDYALQRANDEPINKEHEFFVWLRVGLIHPLVDHAAQAFIDHIEPVCDGSLNRALLEDDSPCHSVVETLKNVAVRHVFSVPEVETLELQGYHIISGLLQHYKPLLELARDDFERLYNGETKGLLIESRLFHRLPNKHVKAYLSMLDQAPLLESGEKLNEEVWECYCRCRLLQDMISGMTDQYALDEYQTLSVIGH